MPNSHFKYKYKNIKYILIIRIFFNKHQFKIMKALCSLCFRNSKSLKENSLLVSMIFK